MAPEPEDEVRRFFNALLEEGSESGELRLEPYQREFLRDTSIQRVVIKSRQVGFSWLFALEALRSVHLRPRALAIFVSLNREEAQGKIEYARELHGLLPEKWRLPIRRASRTELEFQGGGRLVSHPCRAPRGRSRADLYLDELAFYRDDEQVYLGALPVISRGGRIVLASTPFGQRGVFWKQVCRADTALDPEGGAAGLGGGEAGSQTPETGAPDHHDVGCTGAPEPRDGGRGDAAGNPEDAGSGLRLFRVPWWQCSWLRRPGKPPKPFEEMDTAQRVEGYGSRQLRRIFSAMDLESFQQEYECRFVDAAASWIPYEHLLPCVCRDLDLAESVGDLVGEEASLVAGFDVGRSQHASELIVLAREGDGYRLRLCQTLRGAEFAAQRGLLRDLLSLPQVARLCLDATGLGANLAEDLQREFRLRVEGVVFTAQAKESLANSLKLAVEDRRVALAPVRDLLAQIHSVRRLLLAGGAARFDVSASEKHHADKFWALALALHAGEAPPPRVRARRL